MRDLVLIAHILLGATLIVLSLLILLEARRPKSTLLKPLAVLNAAAAWLLLVPSGILYILFYPATKTLVKAGAWPWVHAIFMETKEHWGLLLPIIATLAAALVFSGKVKESRRWWILLAVLAALVGIFGRIITTGALVR